MRPAAYNEACRTKGGWYHTDQIGLVKPADCCFQGLINLLDCTMLHAPGLVVCPGSHKKFNEFFDKYPDVGKHGFSLKGDFISIKGQYLSDFFEAKPIKLCLPSGSLVIWNSKTIHCSAPSSLPRISQPPTRGWTLDRLCGYVCMSPRPKNAKQLQQLLTARINGTLIFLTLMDYPNSTYFLECGWV